MNNQKTIRGLDGWPSNATVVGGGNIEESPLMIIAHVKGETNSPNSSEKPQTTMSKVYN
ncbi:MAG: hypothetical protein IPL12_22225 [Bacteroidetes bacterium]|nr:hypothetical protein [Bacteroidota bacterium]